jgi:hypothetical protein
MFDMRRRQFITLLGGAGAIEAARKRGLNGGYRPSTRRSINA